MKIEPPTLKRKITPCSAKADLPDNFTLPKDVITWLEAQMNEHAFTYLLAHADDGVIWGKSIDQHLITSYEIAQAYPELGDHFVPLHPETLQQVRLFAPHAELYLWRDGTGIWHFRLIVEDEAVENSDLTEAFDEYHLLWGNYADYLNKFLWKNKVHILQEGFSLMSDGAEGLRHIVPISVQGSDNSGDRPLRLLVRHYIKENDIGAAQIAASRLVDLHIK